VIYIVSGMRYPLSEKNCKIIARMGNAELSKYKGEKCETAENAGQNVECIQVNEILPIVE